MNGALGDGGPRQATVEVAERVDHQLPDGGSAAQVEEVGAPTGEAPSGVARATSTPSEASAQPASVEPPGQSWITLYPAWYRDERARLAKRYPNFIASQAELGRGVLTFAGVLRVDLGSEVHEQPGVLTYPEETPYRAPSFVPLREVPATDAWSLDELLHPANVARMPAGYRRHQMSDGTLCLMDAGLADGGEDRAGAGVAGWVSGEAVLRRARGVLRARALGEPRFPYPDTEAAELEEHLPVVEDDILIGDAFFSPSLSGGGTFYGVETLDTWGVLPNHVEQSVAAPRRLFVAMHVTGRGASTSLDIDWRTEQSPALRAAFPFIRARRLSFEQATAAGTDPFPDASLQGVWFDLRREPEPFQTVEELEAQLRDPAVVAPPVADLPDALLAYAGRLEKPTRVYLALRYPGRETGAVDWLFVALCTQEGVDEKALGRAAAAGARREVLRGARVAALRRHAVRRPDLELRNGALAGTLAHRTVVLLGAGALGGDVADALAKAGVGTLKVVDFDRMRPGNVIRHVAGLAATGLAKPDAVRHVVRQHNPYVTVIPLAASATASLSALDSLLRGADLVVSTIADDRAEHVVNEAAVRVGAPVIYGRALRGGAAARVFRVRPGVDGCKACFGMYRVEASSARAAQAAIAPAAPGSDGDAGAHAPVSPVVRATTPAGREAAVELLLQNWVSISEAPGEVIGRECGTPILAGSAVDLRFAADLTARAAVDALAALDGAPDAAWSSLVWTREPLADAGHPDLARAYGTVLQAVPPHPRCPVCARPRTGRIVIAASAHEALRRFAEAKPDRETGGAAIGFEGADGTVVVLEVTDAGPNAVETPTRFVYDAAHVNAWLTDAHARRGARGVYVGEWHTHLERAPQPSARDVASLSAIAEEPQYLTDEPVMLIGGVDPGNGRLVAIHASCFPNQRSMRALPYEVLPDDAAAACALRPSGPGAPQGARTGAPEAAA